MPTATRPPAAKRPQPSSRRGSTTRPNGTPEQGSRTSTPKKPRQSSVQITGEGPQTKGTAVTSSRGGDVEFKRSMNDFLTVMYGQNAGGDKSGTRGTAGHASGTAKGTAATTTASSSNRASQYRAAAGAAPKGPLVKGVLANQAHVPGDNIDSLVSHLVRAYSRSTTPANGFHEEDGEAPISYGGAGAQYGRPRRHTGSQLEVNAFVSQAMDSFFVAPNGSGPLSSKRSMLSSLGMDQNFEKLLSFHPNSNVVEDEEEDTPVAPMYIGEMAMFNPADSRRNDVSVSKSMPMMMKGGTASSRNASPASRGTAAPSARRANLNMSLNSGVAGPSGTGRPALAPVAGRRSLGRSGGLNREMSLDSKAIGGALVNQDDDDDSWADVDAQAVAEAIKNTTTAGEKAPVVSSTRSLMTMSRTKADAERVKKIKALVDDETLSRNVLLAVEHQLRGYIDTAYATETKKANWRRASSASKRTK